MTSQGKARKRKFPISTAASRGGDPFVAVVSDPVLLVPVQMSILTLEQPRSGGSQKTRKDVKVVERQVVEEKRDDKGDDIGATLAPAAARLSAPSSAT